jgi:lipoprotein-anchoring transpeptidase ErfK/SrfK
MGQHSRRSWSQIALAAAVLTGVVGLGAAGTAWAEAPALVPGTPCSAVARACVELPTKRAWLIDDGRIVRGPVPVSIGGPGAGTPTGDFRVEWKHADHRSAEFDDAPMPFSVFFAQGGIAFHEGNLDTDSAGCVRLERSEATEFFHFLQVGDPVQVR